MPDREPDRQWYVAQTSGWPWRAPRPNEDSHPLRRLEALGFEVVRPMELVRVGPHNRRRKREIPVLGNYIVVSADFGRPQRRDLDPERYSRAAARLCRLRASAGIVGLLGTYIDADGAVWPHPISQALVEILREIGTFDKAELDEQRRWVPCTDGGQDYWEFDNPLIGAIVTP